MKKYNLSAIMKRAWELKKEDERNIFSLCLKMAWEESKMEDNKMKENKLEEMLRVAEEMTHDNSRIHLGMDRKVVQKEEDGIVWISIYCYTLNGRYKGNYKCGKVDTTKNTYTPGWDVDLELGEVIR